MTNIFGILEKILLIIGPFLAAWGAIWFKDKIDRKRQFREWFYKHYIFESIAPILEYLSFIETPVFRIGSILQETKIDRPQFPESALAIVYELINSNAISMHVSEIIATYEELASSQKQQLIAWAKGERESTKVGTILVFIGAIIELRGYLSELKAILLETKINKYKDVVKIHALEPVKELVGKIEDNQKKMLELQS